MNRNEQNEVLLKLRMTLGVKGVTGLLYIEALLKKIKLVKKMLLYDIEKGNETFIPKELS